MKRLAHSSSGSVLITVLCASIALVSIALLFGHSMMMAYRGADNDLAGRQADQAIEGAVRYVESLLIDPDVPGVLPDPTTYNAEAVPVGEATIWILGRPDDSTDTTTRTFGLIDEGSKLNLNTATDYMLGQLPGITDDLVQAIIAWRGTGSTDSSAADSSTSGTSTGAGGSSTEKNAPFESIEELALVDGMTRDVLYGEDTNLNGVLDANEDDGDRSPPSDNADGKLDPGIFEYVTVFTSEPNTNGAGDPRHDINDRAALSAVLTDKLSDRADAILRLLNPARKLTSVLQLKFSGGLSDDEFDKVAYELTTTPNAKTLPGLINVNTASATVLACLPGIDADMASQIVSTRLNNVQTTASYGWVTDIIGEAGVASAGQYLTGRCTQVNADVAAVGRNGRGYRRSRFIVDLSTSTPRIIYRRNLAMLGWALGSDIRQDLVSKKDVR